MTSRILKYPLCVGVNYISGNNVEITPRYAGNQRDVVTMWAQVTECESLGEFKRELTISVVATGAEWDMERFAYLGTVITDGGNFVWHVLVERT